MADIFGTGNNDVLTGTAGDDVIDAGAGDDLIDGGLGADQLYGRAGSDIFRFSTVRTGAPTPTSVGLIDGGDGYDIIDANRVEPVSVTTIRNGIGENILALQVGNQYFEIRNVEEIDLGAGANFINTPFPFFTAINIFAGDGNDVANVAGPIALLLEGGDDTAFISGYFSDSLTIRGAINGGTGNDTLQFNLGFTVDVAAGTATSGTQTYDIAGFENYSAFAQNGYSTTILGSASGEAIFVNSQFDDGSIGVTFDGRGGDDTLSGSRGNDSLAGGSGNDLIDGRSGNDLITGGAGLDVLTGGVGRDIFQDTTAGLNGDRITDFTTDDRIVIRDADIASFSFSLTGSTLSYSGGSMTLAGVSGALVASAAVGGGVQLRLATTVDASHDFNGDGRSDILWRHSSGEIGQWLALRDGTFANNGGAAANAVDPSWRVVGLGDFNGDGRDDILWRHESGVIGEWQGQPNGSFMNTSNVAANPVDNSWNVVGVADFNGDGRDDIFWRHSSGVITEWLGQANGGFVNNSGAAANAVDNSWTVVASGDFNGDGRGDVLWRHSSGVFAEWQGTATGALINAGIVMGGATGTVVGTGDFNGDGYDDVLMRAANGGITEWQGQTNGQFSAFTPTSQLLDTSWKIADIGDFNGDGRDDLFWRHVSGAQGDWVATANGDFAYNASLPTVDNSWTVQSPDGILF